MQSVAGIDSLVAGEHRLRPVGDRRGGPSLPPRGPNVLDPAGPDDIWWVAAQRRLRAASRDRPLALAGLAAGWLALRWCRWRNSAARGRTNRHGRF